MIPSFDTAEFEALKALLTPSAKIRITTHHKPDGDAMGSSLALYNYLKIKGHDVAVITPSDYPDFLHWMPGHTEVVSFSAEPMKGEMLMAEADIIFCLDFNAISRIEKLAPVVAKSSAVKVLIDHHLAPEDFCRFTFSFPTSCATSELVFHFITALDGRNAISKDVASCLYAGIMTDTGSFRFSSMTADTHRVVAALMDAGASNYIIHEAVYDNFSESRTRFLGYCLSEKLVVLEQYRTAYMAISLAELTRFNHQSGDTEGIVNYALGVKGIRLAAFFCEQEGLIKISFRSKDSFSVKELASVHFNGGGHTNAAGGRSHLSLEQTVTKFLGLLPGLSESLHQ